MCSKPRNEDKDNIDQDIEVCAIGVQTKTVYGKSWLFQASTDAIS